MALTISLSAAIANTRTSWTLTDGTVYGTGGNPARSAVAVFVSSFKMSYENEETALSVVGNDEDPETDSSWTIGYEQDGWFKTDFVIIPDYAAGTYAQYAAVFDPGTGNVYRSKAAGNTESDLTNTVWWELITEPALLAENKDTASESLNIDSIVYQRVFSANGQYTFGNLLSEQCMCSDCDENESLRTYNIFAQWLDGVAIADSRSEVLDGELICRRIQSKFIDC
jgi:hypothetical protein